MNEQILETKATDGYTLRYRSWQGSSNDTLVVTLHGMLGDHLGSSLAAETAVSGVNFDWWNEFLAQAAGVGQSFVPAIIGFAAVIKNLGGIADAQQLPLVIASAVTAQFRADCHRMAISLRLTRIKVQRPATLPIACV